jgi:hypothetical protein
MFRLYSFRSLFRRPERRGRFAWRRSFAPRLEVLANRTVLSTWTVTSPADSGDGSLRAAIAGAQSGDQIAFDQSLQGQTIALTSGQLVLTKSLDIEGLGADLLAISGSDASRAFDIASGVSVVIDDLTIADGRATQGAGIDNAGILTVSRCTLSHNQAVGSAADEGRGGGIFNAPGATLFVAYSTFIDNQAVGGDGGPGQPGGFGTGGGIDNLEASLTVTHSMFTPIRRSAAMVVRASVVGSAAGAGS